VGIDEIVARGMVVSPAPGAAPIVSDTHAAMLSLVTVQM
jgi:hypothetical protein